MINFISAAEKRIERRLQQEEILWLTTVDAQDTPQPRPVWFHWDGETVMIFSQTLAAKVRHIARNPRVALNFNTDEGGGDVGVLIGEARILQGSLGEKRRAAYLQKYAEGIRDLGMTPEGMIAEYPVVILVAPLRLRGM
jgi:PPOX class probable F420-dependent enzyme